MTAIHPPLTALTAADLMTRDVIRLPKDMPLRDAVKQLLDHQISGAPVVDEDGRCIGVFSAVDFLRLGLRRDDVARPASPRLPLTCAFQVRHNRTDGGQAVFCMLPPGVCPIQVPQGEGENKDVMLCGQPHCVMSDWQVVELEKLPTNGVADSMTADPVLVGPETPIRKLARLMIDAHIHRLIVVDDEKVPVGVVASTDLLAALARAED